MQKNLNILWKVALILIAVTALVGTGRVYANRDRLVTSNIAMDYFVKTVNKNDENRNKSFVAKSNNDVLYTNFVTTLNNVYHFEGVSDFKFKITDKELFGNGKYQCYFSNAFENYVPKCDLENEGRYMNYLVDIEVRYVYEDEEIVRKEKGLVVFVKDMVKGNYFTWKLVRFDRYTVVEN